MKYYNKLILLFFLLLVNGCTLLQDSTSSQAWLKPGVQVSLPAPDLPTPLKRQQLLTASIKNKSESLVTLLDVSDGQLTLAGLSPLGIRLFKVTYSATGIMTEQSIVLPELPPVNQVLADIMLSYWPLSTWQDRLPKNWSLTDEGNVRLLRDETGNVVTRITYLVYQGEREPVNIEQLVFDYQITIKMMEDAE